MIRAKVVYDTTWKDYRVETIVNGTMDPQTLYLASNREDAVHHQRLIHDIISLTSQYCFENSLKQKRSNLL